MKCMYRSKMRRQQQLHELLMNGCFHLKRELKLFDKRAQHKSLSQIVENYFKIVTSETAPIEHKISPLVEDLIGSIKVPQDFDYSKAKYQYLMEKHLHD